jgi:hypothetical protein
MNSETRQMVDPELAKLIPISIDPAIPTGIVEVRPANVPSYRLPLSEWEQETRRGLRAKRKQERQNKQQSRRR